MSKLLLVYKDHRVSGVFEVTDSVRRGVNLGDQYLFLSSTDDPAI